MHFKNYVEVCQDRHMFRNNNKTTPDCFQLLIIKITDKDQKDQKSITEKLLQTFLFTKDIS